MNRLFSSVTSMLCILFTGLTLNGAIVRTNLSGLQMGDSATISISSEKFMATQVLKANGSHQFPDVPEGLHAVKVEVSGYNLPDSKLVRVNPDGSVDPKTDIQLVITKMDDDDSRWTHSWEADGSVSGYTTTSHINIRPQIDFLGKKLVPADVPSMALLHENYNIILSDEEEQWTQEYAYRLLETLKTIPVNNSQTKLAKFVLTSSSLADDITVNDLGEGKEVMISKDAFYYANPFLVTLDGVRGRFFSKRLHHAMVKYVSDFGKDTGIIDQILRERFGCSISIPDITALTGEDAANFQEFYPSELVAIINMFEEMPEGFHKIPQLKYLVRRQDGHTNPMYSGAAAISWCSEEGYIEFINAPHIGVSAFGGNNEQFDTQRLILHEKTHFLWAFSFSEEIKNEWATIGGWYRDPNAGDDPDAGWSTTKTTEFVSAYAHAINPNEDMAESVAFYLKDPEKLRSRSMAKYDFIRDRIMHGTRYISSIPDHLTFEVLNLWPDYDYPGKITKVEIAVEGKPEEDKLLTFDIWLNHTEGCDDGASGAYTRIMSPRYIDDEGHKNGTYIDLGFSPVDGDNWHLRGTATISKYSKAGYWVPGDITVSDPVGNERYEGRNDCITNIYINNPLEDLIAPKYEKGSLKYSLSEVNFGEHHEQLLSVKVNAYDNIGIAGVYGGLYTGVDSNHMPGWSTIIDKDNKTIEIQYRIRDYFHTTDYYIAHIGINDIAGNEKDIRFSEDPNHEPVQKIHITTPEPDYEHPEIDLNRIYVFAEPTHPEAPNGETLVNISFYARDNISGLTTTGFSLRDPQGIMHFLWGPRSQGDEYGYFLGDPTAWTRYEHTILLPQGSAPGIWGLGEILVRDHAYNDYTYNFVETLIFEPDDSEDGWELFADWEDTSSLRLLFPNSPTDAYGFTYRIINEETGEEITGENKNQSRASVEDGCLVDVSSLSDGNLLVIATVKDAEGTPISVKSKRIVKSTGTGGVTVTEKDDNKLQIIIENRQLTINGVDGSESAALYDVQGQTWFSGSVAECQSLTLPSGIYVLKIGDYVNKLLIK